MAEPDFVLRAKRGSVGGGSGSGSDPSGGNGDAEPQLTREEQEADMLEALELLKQYDPERYQALLAEMSAAVNPGARSNPAPVPSAHLIHV